MEEMLDKKIKTLIKLSHWERPSALEDGGDWLKRDRAEWFGEYGRVLYRALDGRVKKWVTLNEPWVVTDGGYLHGVPAPGHRSKYEAPIASHNLMRPHCAAVQAYRAESAQEIGLVVNIEPKQAATDSSQDADPVKRAYANQNHPYLHPDLLRTYSPQHHEHFNYDM